MNTSTDTDHIGIRSYPNGRTTISTRWYPDRGPIIDISPSRGGNRIRVRITTIGLDDEGQVAWVEGLRLRRADNTVMLHGRERRYLQLLASDLRQVVSA